MKLKRKGLHIHRFRSNPKELDFAIAWDRINQSESHPTLAYLVQSPEKDQRFAPDSPSDRDWEVANTVIQWLGSPVGQVFLRDAGFISADTAIIELSKLPVSGRAVKVIRKLVKT